MADSAQQPVRPNLIQSYGEGRFRINEALHAGPLIVGRDFQAAWTVAGFAEVTADSLDLLRDRTPPVELLLLGCGPSLQPPPVALRAALKAWNIALEPMDTGAACRTYNVLLMEERRVAAALLPV